MKKMHQGFTLIELMIVVAIIGILAAIAIPAYTDYVTRSKWSDTITSVASIKTAIAECLDNNGQTLTSCDELDELEPYGTPDDATGIADTKYLAQISVIENTAAIRMDGATGSDELGECSFDLTPQVGAAGQVAVNWIPVVQAGTNCAKFIKGAS